MADSIFATYYFGRCRTVADSTFAEHYFGRKIAAALRVPRVPYLVPKDPDEVDEVDELRTRVDALQERLRSAEAQIAELQALHLLASQALVLPCEKMPSTEYLDSLSLRATLRERRTK